MNKLTAFRVSAAVAFLGVALGAFGAHGLEPQMKALGTVEIWKTASLYHLIHAVAMLAISGQTGEGSRKIAWWFFLIGILIFGGTLYVLAATGTKWLGAITPLGGLSFLAGWAVLALAKASKNPNAA
ncbi:MAG TPA: DUF423 domain-containing protein [Chthoniobacterales bacterium]